MKTSMFGGWVRAVLAAGLVAFGFGSASADEAPLNVYRVTTAGAGTKDGSSWENAAALAEIWPTLADGDELWLKAETYALTAALATDKQVTIRGGFAGGETSAEARTGTALTVFDGAKTYPNVAEGNSALLEFSATSGKITLDRLELKQSYTRGVQSTGGASVRLDDCVINDNGWRETTSKARSLPGRGAYLVGANGATAKFVRCLFKRNNNHSNGQNDYFNQDGCGAYVTTFGSLTMESTTFYQNGIALERTGKNPGREDTWGAALCVNATPVTATDCDFRANSNQNHGNGGSYGSGAGGMVFLNGNCGASTFTSCRFVGNFSRDFDPGSPTAGKFSGTLVLNLASTCSCLLDRCTVAYNFSRVGDAAAGVTVRGGAFTARNSIFWGNFATYRGSVGAANNVYVAAGSAVIDNCLVDGTGAGYFEPASNASLKPKFSGTTVTDDPLMVSSRADFLAMLAGTKPTDDAFQPTMDDTNARANMPSTGSDPNTLDVHLKSKAGRYADGAWVTDDVQSPAIDGATEDAPYANETAPNGKRANLGGYGNTVEASRSLVGQPAIAEAALDQSNGTTMPDIAFTLGGEGEFKASVWVCHGRTKGSDDSTVGWEHVTLVTEAGTIGDSFKVSSKWVYEPGDTISWRVIVKASGGEANAGATEQISPTASKPKFWTAGGDPTKVIHVWAGAADYDCDGTGTSWRNAVGTLTAALALVSATKTEIWIAGDGALTAEPATVSRGLVVRGGFTAEESDPAERPAGTISLVDAGGVYKNGLRVSNPADTTAVFDRLDVRNALERGIYKTGAGSVEVTDCRLENNGTATDAYTTVSGRGAYLSGAAGATALVRGCTFRHNQILMASYSAQTSHGAGAYVSTFDSFTLEDSVFTENGESLGNTAGHGNTRGFALSVNNAPIAAHGCVFRANIGCAQGVGDGVSGGGGIVTLLGACDGSSFSHCLWSGNFHTSMSPVGTRGGALEIDMGDAAYTCSLSHCTIAYNLCYGSAVAAGLQVDKGTVTVADSIIWGNSIAQSGNTAGADVYVADADSKVTLSTTLLGGSDGRYAAAVSVGGVDPGAGMVYGDPLFATSLTDYGKGYPTSESLTFASFDACEQFDVHLRSSEGRWNGSGWVKDAVQSPAVDRAASSIGDEPAPNGYKANLGFYGQTAEASKTPVGQPAFAELNVIESYDVTMPAIAVTVGGTGIFAATLTCSFDTQQRAGDQWAYVVTRSPIANGDSVTVPAGHYFNRSETIYWRAVLSAPDAEDVVRTGSFTVTAETPMFVGHGGDPTKVVHVRLGANGARTGDNWEGGVTTLADALELVTDTRNQIWIMGDIRVETAPESLSLSRNITIIGGFTGAEDTEAARPEGCYTTIDGTMTNNCLSVSVDAGKTLTLKGLAFTRSSKTALTKTGAGNLALVGCRFTDNGWYNFVNYYGNTGDSGKSQFNGGGANVSGGGIFAVTNCLVDGNVEHAPGGQYGNAYSFNGCGFYASGVSVDIVNTSFLSNGVPAELFQAWCPAGREGMRGTALYIQSAPSVKVEGSRFVANRGCNHQGGAAIHIQNTGAAPRSIAFRSCLVAGNFSEVWYDGTAYTKTGAPLTIIGSKQSAASPTTVELDRCTIAYNSTSAGEDCAGVMVIGADNAPYAVSVRNSIFCGNLASFSPAEHPSAVDFRLGKNVSLDLDYSLIQSTELPYVMLDDASATATFGDHLVLGQDARFVMRPSEFLASLQELNGRAIATPTNSVRVVTKPDADPTAWNFHLRGGKYLNELTGETERYSGASPAVGAGDPAVVGTKEPGSKAGHRINLGYYGGTPWATGPRVGLFVIVR